MNEYDPTISRTTDLNVIGTTVSEFPDPNGIGTTISKRIDETHYIHATKLQATVNSSVWSGDRFV